MSGLRPLSDDDDDDDRTIDLPEISLVILGGA
jgi:hypothetical protein